MKKEKAKVLKKLLNIQYKHGSKELGSFCDLGCVHLGHSAYIFPCTICSEIFYSIYDNEYKYFRIC